MKLEEIARQSIDIIKSEAGGIGTAELAKRLNVPKRRVYDVKAIMKAAGLITTSRDKNGTKIVWTGGGSSPDKEVSRVRSNKLKISTSGFIISVQNKGTEVIIEGTAPSMTIEAI
ncbi:MAG: E2F family transcription factor [Candidatus Heimdallarchaeota archaeon]|nr:E2F family transcription factor [Candidatus Heimdallarchaeota archaeon]MDH5645816.1 E2F family transcription factor [Candidatus Heimdallarchaeota archaeon]